MARVIRQFPDPPPAGGVHGIKYPWDEWLDGKVWELEIGADFYSSRESFRHAAGEAGRRRGFQVQTAVPRGENTVIIQAVRNGMEAFPGI